MTVGISPQPPQETVPLHAYNSQDPLLADPLKAALGARLAICQ